MAVALSFVYGGSAAHADLLRFDDGNSHTIATEVDEIEITNKSTVYLDHGEATSVSVNDSRFVVVDSIVSNDIDAVNNSVLEIGGTEGSSIGGYVNASNATVTVMNNGELGDDITLLGSRLVVQDGGRIGSSGAMLSALDGSSIAINDGGTALFTVTRMSGNRIGRAHV